MSELIQVDDRNRGQQADGAAAWVATRWRFRSRKRLMRLWSLLPPEVVSVAHLIRLLVPFLECDHSFVPHHLDHFERTVVRVAG